MPGCNETPPNVQLQVHDVWIQRKTCWHLSGEIVFVEIGLIYKWPGFIDSLSGRFRWGTWDFVVFYAVRDDKQLVKDFSRESWRHVPNRMDLFDRSRPFLIIPAINRWNNSRKLRSSRCEFVRLQLRRQLRWGVCGHHTVLGLDLGDYQQNRCLPTYRFLKIVKAQIKKLEREIIFFSAHNQTTCM